MLDLSNVFMALLCVSKIRGGFYGSCWPSMHKEMYSGMLALRRMEMGRFLGPTDGKRLRRRTVKSVQPFKMQWYSV